MKLSPAQALDAAIKEAGSQLKLASAIGCTQTAVYKWVKGAGGCSGKFALRIERATGISRHDLAPEFYPTD